MFKIEISADSFDDLKEKVIALAMCLENEEKVKSPAKKATKKTTKKVTKKEEPTKEEPTPTTPEYTTKDITKALQTVNKECGLPVAKEILNKCGANRVSEIASEDFVSFMNLCEAAIENSK